MPLHLDDQTIIAPHGSLLIASLPQYAQGHRAEVSKTAACEALGAALLAGPMDDASLAAFVKEVCAWGGYAGISGRVLKHNTPEAIRTALLVARARIEADPPDVAGALAAVNTLKYLGSPSFSSKHLRMLWPRHCAVLDSLLSEALAYPYTREGFVQFTRDLGALARALELGGHANPFERPERAWYLADVEAGLFRWVWETRGSQG